MNQEQWNPKEFPWEEIKDRERFCSHDWTKRILDGLSVYRPGTTEIDPGRQKQIVSYLKDNAQYALARLQALADELKQQFVQKDEIIDMVIVSAIAHQPMLLLGPPGTAKSKIILKFCEGLGIGRAGDAPSRDKTSLQYLLPDRTGNVSSEKHTVYQYLLHGFTEPDEVLGPVDIEQLRKESKFRRIREGSIIDSEVVFLDEVFRANSAILNALLTVMNERRVYEGGQAYPARARLIYGASNDIPSPQQMKDLKAFYERFILRMESDFVPMRFAGSEKVIPDKRKKLLEQGWRAEIRDLRAGYQPQGAAMSPIACLNDILFLNRVVTELWGGADFNDPFIQLILQPYHRLVIALSGGDKPICTIDDRKFIRLFLLVRAHALYSHNGPPRLKNLTVLKHIWHDLDSKQKVADAVTKFITEEK
uniref:MoxR-like ATPase n=1 Tax=Candidatus Kentrum sp. FM TaxID=2126340 RepID=A0A450VL31_9GAMM|nr:MAG: MoxR-like ATPase [Candidatus Kentron sp. FM]VFJ43343.1 MAG: MoxR-like ATPase [Candidatus Kentron sp. FM]VFK05503.1 MAG: MoxR-like ATPase [Candidatus Kentron sp. FM]